LYNMLCYRKVGINLPTVLPICVHQECPPLPTLPYPFPLGLGPMDLKICTLAKKPATVTQQLTRSTDFRQNYLCDFHLCCLFPPPPPEATVPGSNHHGQRKYAHHLPSE
jgi:hypothetical protein